MEFEDRVKSYLRQNWFYKKYCQTRVNDIRYFFRSLRYYRRYYSFGSERKTEGHTLFFIIDPYIHHPGLADRLKAIVGSYYIAQQSGFDFKIIFHHPFKLEDYLNENKVKWIGKEEDLCYNLRDVRIIPYNGGGKIPVLNKRFHQYHTYNYIGYNILQTNQIENHEVLWGDLFRQLFTPKEGLSENIQRIGLTEDSYWAIHLRFVNALEQFEGAEYNFLSKKQQLDLIERCRNAIKDILNNCQGKTIVVFSDSHRFLESIKDLPVVITSGEIGHISFVGNNCDVVMKTFEDFYLISRAEKVIRILSEEMYRTVFSYYAALAGRKKFEDVFV